MDEGGKRPVSIPGIEIVGVVGRGGVADILEGVYAGRPVAIKRLALDRALPPKAIERFRREAHLAARLDHRNIVRVLDVKEHDDQQFIIMELLRGRDVLAIRRVAPSEPRIPAHVAVAIAAQVLDALVYAHG